MWAIVPIKTPGAAKSRLGERLSASARADLVMAMARHVLGALRRTPGIAGVTVVTSGAEVEALARELGLDCLRLPRDGGMNEDIALALAARRDGPVAIVAGDLPHATPEAFAEVARACTAGTVVLAPDRHGGGTNVLALGAGVALAPAFGPGSFARHRAAAIAAGADVTVLQSDALSFDVDTPDDLAWLQPAARPMSLAS
jgi:2-phospho-L-lactate guanylyltransferase